MNIHIRLVICTDLGPVGPRLGRGTPIPATETVFPDTQQGRMDAEVALKSWREYVGKIDKKKRAG